MPKVRRKNLPPALLTHLLDRVQERRISADQLGMLADWLAHEPDVPDGKWFKRIPGMTVCGEKEWLKTFLVPGQVPNGEEIGWDLGVDTAIVFLPQRCCLASRH